ncbi:uncharacterized protein PAN0_002c1294 [Moesziomyces antarcticus]|uniref:Uncharacterized protein n=1 Tax=Pseudozyma antarctica TaxID=84753 RepID=A0A5C3FG93_PSEA2|nr:uncharacterized protein PAN0_002c1294 [Moesziomyces antarcticus]GAK63092.1 hypothetical protein PAN0_002c1294 [Moesziomyces antarcticus]SPO43424.1 uncharacterized protein PSANT_01109 [Moesziomyces antarcticus]
MRAGLLVSGAGPEPKRRPPPPPSCGSKHRRGSPAETSSKLSWIKGSALKNIQQIDANIKGRALKDIRQLDVKIELINDPSAAARRPGAGGRRKSLPICLNIKVLQHGLRTAAQQELHGITDQ